MTIDFSGLSGEFLAFVQPLGDAAVRSEFQVTQIPAPRGIAEQALALSIDVEHGQESDHGVSRIVFCFDSQSPEGWHGTDRIIGYAKSPIELYMAADEYLTQLPWQWLTESLTAAGAQFAHEAGTTTTAVSTGHGSLVSQPQHAELEIRGSWTPLSRDARAHLNGWVSMLALISGLPPSDESVARIR